MTPRLVDRDPSPAARGLAIRAELAAMRDRLDLIIAAIDDTVGGETSAPQRALVIEGPVVNRKTAAGEIGWREQRLTRAIIRHNAMFPNDPLGWKAGGNDKGQWQIPLGRLIRWHHDRPEGWRVHQDASKCITMRGAVGR